MNILNNYSHLSSHPTTLWRIFGVERADLRGNGRGVRKGGRGEGGKGGRVIWDLETSGIGSVRGGFWGGGISHIEGKDRFRKIRVRGVIPCPSIASVPHLSPSFSFPDPFRSPLPASRHRSYPLMPSPRPGLQHPAFRPSYLEEYSRSRRRHSARESVVVGSSSFSTRGARPARGSASLE